MFEVLQPKWPPSTGVNTNRRVTLSERQATRT